MAGQLTRASVNADKVTAAAVCLPAGGLKAIRRRLPRNPPKWRDASDESLAMILDVLFSEAICVACVIADKTSQDWVSFWDAASEVHIESSNLSRQAIGHMRPANLLKGLLFNQAAILAGARAVRYWGSALYQDQRGRLQVNQDIIFDSDLEGADNIETIDRIWSTANLNQPLTNSLGIDWVVPPVCVATEQSEPLLLLADYAAGIVHASVSAADTLKHSQVTVAGWAAAKRRLQTSGWFFSVEPLVVPSYFDIFPEFRRFVGAS